MADEPTKPPGADSKSILQASKDIAKLKSQHKAYQDSVKNAQATINKAYDAQFASLSKLMDEEQKAAELAKIRADLAKQHAEEAAAVETALKEQIAALKLAGKGYEHLVAEGQKHLNLITNQAKMRKKEAEAAEAVAKATATIRENLTDTTKKADKLAASWFGIDDVAKSVGAEISKHGNIFKGVAKKAWDITKHMKAQVTAANLMGAAMQKGFEAAEKGIKDLDTHFQKFGPAQGISDAKAYANTMRIQAKESQILTEEQMHAQDELINKMVEGTILIREEGWEAHTSFRDTSAAYRQASEEVQMDAAKTASIIEKRLNVGVGKSANLFETLTKTFGKSGKAANKMTADMAYMAQKQKMDVNRYFEDFNNISADLAKFGLPDIKKEFNALAVIQEKTGASMGKLMGAMDTFSTFEGALNAASKLNAAFGTTIDGMEIMDTLMKEGPAKSMLLLRQRLEETGTSFEDMNYAQKKAMADASQMDMDTLQKFMTTPFTELEDAVAKSGGTIKGTTNALGKINEQSKEFQTTTDATKKAQDQSAAALKRMGEGLHGMDKWYSQNAPTWLKWTTSLASNFGSIGGSIISLIASMAQWMAARKMMSATEVASSAKEGVAATLKGAAQKAAALGASAAQAALNIAKAIGNALSGPIGWKSLAIAAAVTGAAYMAYRTFMTGPGSGEEFAPGQNMISDPTLATVGEAGSPEIATIGGDDFLVGREGPEEIALGPGDKVQTLEGGAGGMPREVVMNFTFIDDNGAKKTQRIRREFKELMNENLQFSYS